MYGAVVPFWFIGAKHISLRFGVPLADADAMLLFPEGLIALVAPPFGHLIDRQRWSLRRHLLVSSLSLLLISASLLCLAHTRLPPIGSALALGFGYAIGQSRVWAAFKLVTPPPLLNFCVGLLGSGMNLLPAIVPAMLDGDDGSRDLSVLAAVGLLCAQWGSEWWPLLLLAAVGALGWAAPFRLADGAFGGPRWIVRTDRPWKPARD